jgi:hypothetical protein
MSEITTETKPETTDTIILDGEPEAITTGKENSSPSREDLKKQGWSAQELDSAEKRGMITKKKEVEKAEVKPDATTEQKAEEVQKPEEVKERRGSLPEFTFKTSEQEKAWLEAFGPGTEQRAMYFRMKNERQQRQAAENRVREIEARLKEVESKTVKAQPEVDENGNEIDPEDKPMTMREWKAFQQQQREEEQRQYEEAQARGGAAEEALHVQEEYAKSIYADYDDVVNLAVEIRKNPAILDANWKRQQADKLWQQLHELAGQADKVGIDDLNAALISYELGKLHPNYGRSDNHGQRPESQHDGKKDPKNANGSVTPEQMKRIEANTQRREIGRASWRDRV